MTLAWTKLFVRMLYLKREILFLNIMQISYFYVCVYVFVAFS